MGLLTVFANRCIIGNTYLTSLRLLKLQAILARFLRELGRLGSGLIAWNTFCNFHCRIIILSLLLLNFAGDASSRCLHLFCLVMVSSTGIGFDHGLALLDSIERHSDTLTYFNELLWVNLLMAV